MSVQKSLLLHLEQKMTFPIPHKAHMYVLIILRRIEEKDQKASREILPNVSLIVIWRKITYFRQFFHL